jgi:hypothetical protein
MHLGCTTKRARGEQPAQPGAHSAALARRAGGFAALGGVEYAVLQDAVYNLRCCIATAGGGIGATARGDMWPILFGAITVWLGPPALISPLRLHRSDPFFSTG